MKIEHKRNRAYDWKKKLLTWSQNRCVICKKFLSKHQKKYCAKHSVSVHKETAQKWYQDNRELTRSRSYNRYHGRSIE